MESWSENLNWKERELDRESYRTWLRESGKTKSTNYHLTNWWKNVDAFSAILADRILLQGLINLRLSIVEYYFKFHVLIILLLSYCCPIVVLLLQCLALILAWYQSIFFFIFCLVSVSQCSSYCNLVLHLLQLSIPLALVVAPKL